MNFHGVWIVSFLIMSNFLFIANSIDERDSIINLECGFSQYSRANDKIFINEILSDPASDWDGDLVYDSSGDEWVELYNPGATEINISGWYLNDSITQRYIFPDGLIIPSDGFYVAFGSNQSLGLNNGGDTVELYNSSGILIDTVTYSYSFDDISLGRVPDGSNNWTDLKKPTPNQKNAQRYKVVINEFMFDPKGTDTGNEWIELYNNHSETIDMEDWELTDQDGDVDYTFTSLKFPPGKYILLHTGRGVDDLDFSDNVTNLYMDRTSSMLNNDGDDILLLSDTGLCMDYVAYGKSTSIDPPLGGLDDWDGLWFDQNDNNFTGGKSNPYANYSESIKRINNGEDTNSVFDWNNASGSNVTPGRNNSYVFGFEIAVDEEIKYLDISETIWFNISIFNTGNIKMVFFLETSRSKPGWTTELNITQFSIEMGAMRNITLTINAPSDLTYCTDFSINISVTAINVNQSENLTLRAIIPAVDLEIIKLTFDGMDSIDEIFEGEVIYLKATLDNTGLLDGGAFTIGFYFDEINNNNLIGIKQYDYIYTTNYKYPAVYWDTLGLTGNHTIIVTADINDEIIESNEGNNRFESQIKLRATSPTVLEKSMLLTEVYYDTLTNYDVNEYVKIFNPTQSVIDISGWQITDNPVDDFEDTISIPDNTNLKPATGLYLTENAEAFLKEMGFEPDFACEIGISKNIRLFENTERWPGFANSGDLVVLRNQYRHIIDLVSYGASDTHDYSDHWHGIGVPDIPEGKILKRQKEKYENSTDNTTLKFIDTDTASDWQAPRLYGPGQTDFYPVKFNFHGRITPFANPENSYNTIISEIDKAIDYIHLNVYQFTHPLLASSMLNALNRGVSVKILLEGNPVGWNMSNVIDPGVIKEEEYTEKYLLTQLFEAGAEIKFLSNLKNDLKIKTLNKRYNYNHAKYTIIDGHSTIIMSGNWKPTSVSVDSSFGNREWGVVVENSAVTDYFESVFISDWTAFSDFQNDTHCYDSESIVYGPPPNFFEIEYKNSSNYYEYLESDMVHSLGKPIEGNFSAIPVLSPDTSSRAEMSIISMINNAQESVYIQQMDCNLDWRFSNTQSNSLILNWSDPKNYYLNWLDGNSYYNEYLKSAISAAKRGCDVKILLDSRYTELDAGPGKLYQESEIDNLDVVQYINELARRDGISDRLEARLAYLSGLEKIHNKGVVVDEELSLLSSINWNHNSVANNREAGVIITNSELAKFYTELFLYDWSRSKSINEPFPLNGSERSVLITEIYADTYLSRDSDEYIAIHNPSNEQIDISGWVLTDKLTSYGGYEGVLTFPVGSSLAPNESIYITRTATDFYREHGILPDFEFINDSYTQVRQMEIIDRSTATSTNRGIQLANKGDELVLADEYLFFDTSSEHEHIIDMVVYGNSSYTSDFISINYPFNSHDHWFGRSVYNVSEGEILKRNRHEIINNFIDTDNASDWENNHIYHPGQSDFRFKTINYTGSITLFSSPDSSYDVLSSEFEKAKNMIFVSIYQFHHLYLMEKLINASMRGVIVKVLADGSPVGGLTDLARYVAKNLVEAGCEVRFIRSDTQNNIHRRYKFLHNKYAVIDNISVVIMSENWKVSGVPVDNTAGNRGWGVVVRNRELSKNFAQVFLSDWNKDMKDIFSFNNSNPKYGDPPEDFLPSWSVFGGDYKPRFKSKTINGEFEIIPVIAPDTTLNEYGSIIELINSAEESVYIEQLSSYIDWDTKGRNIENLYLQAAINAARRGCDVKILLDSSFAFQDNPSLDNFDTVDYINSIARSENLTDRLEARLIYLNGYDGKNELTILHNKGIIVDLEKTLVSSINWATGSTIYNREAGVIIENTQVAKYFNKLFQYDWNLTLQELLDISVLYSDTREILPGEKTTYSLSIQNLQSNKLNLSLSLNGLDKYWDATLDSYHLTLQPSDNNNISTVEVKLTVSSPTENEIQDYLAGVNKDIEIDFLSPLELGLVVEVNNMSADMVYTTTYLLEIKDDQEPPSTTENFNEGFNIDPWLVIIILAFLLIAGAITRDVIHAKLGTPKKKDKLSDDDHLEE